MIERGDVVELRCGGPRMTVESVIEDEIDCVWFDVDDHVQRSSFPSHCLIVLLKLGNRENWESE